MNRAVTLVFLIASVVIAADSSDLVREAANGWTQAAVKQDASGLRRYMAEDLQYAHAGGNTQTRDEYIAAVTKGPSHYESFTFSDVKVKLYGKVAVLTGFVDVKMAGQDSFRVRTLQVYTENNGQWQMSAHQSTRLGR
jgi:ketosteroid isomerase-like protein